MAKIDHSDLPFILEVDDRTGQILKRPRRASGGMMPEAATTQDLLLAKLFIRMDGLQSTLERLESAIAPTPRPIEKVGAPIEVGSEPLPQPPIALVNLNTATPGEIEALPHLGKKSAQRLVKEREAGSFSSLQDALDRSDISHLSGDRLTELESLVTV